MNFLYRTLIIYIIIMIPLSVIIYFDVKHIYAYTIGCFVVIFIYYMDRKNII